MLYSVECQLEARGVPLKYSFSSLRAKPVAAHLSFLICFVFSLEHWMVEWVWRRARCAAAKMLLLGFPGIVFCLFFLVINSMGGSLSPGQVNRGRRFICMASCFLFYFFKNKRCRPGIVDGAIFLGRGHNIHKHLLARINRGMFACSI